MSWPAPPGAPLLHPKLAEAYRQKVAELHKALEHPIHAMEAVEKIRALIDAIVLTPEDGKLRVDLRRCARRHLERSPERPKATSGGRGQCRAN